MKRLSRDPIEALTRFKGDPFWTTSFYLDTDKGKFTKKEIGLAFKNLLADGRLRLEALALSKDRKESLLEDLDRIAAFGAQSLAAHGQSGLAVFSCNKKKFWDVLGLPHGPRDRLLFDQNPYVRPLVAILDKYRRLCVFLVNRREAKWYEVFMEEIAPLQDLTSDVPSRVKVGGFEGTEGKRIERRLEAHVLDHLKKSAQLTFDLFKKNRFDGLLLGCEEKYCSELEPLLHTYLKEKLAGRIKAKPGDPPAEILKEAVKLEEKMEQKSEEETVGTLVAELERGGRACSGLKDTLRHINQGDVQILAVSHNFSKKGRLCPSCRFLYVEETICPVCDKATTAVLDVVDEAIEAAVAKNAQVKQVTPPSKLDHYGKIGALLRYKV
jgi:peptide subunit release factor 1 (eRF1)